MQARRKGTPRDKPAPVQWTDGWNIKPDVIFEMQKPFKVPASSTVQYTYFVVPTNFKQDMWIVDGEVRAGNRKVVHHASVQVRLTPGSQWMKKMPRSARHSCRRNPRATRKRYRRRSIRRMSVRRTNGWSATFLVFHAEYFDLNRPKRPRLVRTGSDLVFEMHYTPNGNEAEDQTKVGFVFRQRSSLRKTGW